MKYNLLQYTRKGLFCPRGDFYIDPRSSVGKALITHAHADHARPGHISYLAHPHTTAVMKYRLGSNNQYETIKYGVKKKIGGVSVTFYPSGHTIGASQILIEDSQERWIVTGDYKLQDDGFAQPFEHIICDVFVTESTFALPLYNWKEQAEIIDEIKQWWLENQEKGRASIITCYSFGKSQRLIDSLDKAGVGPLLVHGAIYNTNQALIDAGVKLLHCKKTNLENKELFSKALVLAPMSATRTSWIKRFKKSSLASASGWMQVRGYRRRLALDRGFVLSDHADWKGILQAIEASQASTVLATHGYSGQLARYLREEKRLDAYVLEDLLHE